jgi:outer membrane protein OmpA-like peptidoglycan-associated protein
MSAHAKSRRGFVAVTLLAAFGVLFCADPRAAAQDQPSPKWELYGGYSIFDPSADIHGILPGGILPVSSRLEWNPRGVGASLTYDFNRWLGLTLDVSTHRNSGETGVVERVDDAALSNLSLGPKFTFRHSHFSPFLEVLVGDHRLMPDAFHDIQKLGVMAGGGLDINLSRHIALRPIRADYVYSTYRYGPSASTPKTAIEGARLQAGLVFMWGGAQPPASPTAACSIDPADVIAGDPVTARADGSGFNRRSTIQYSWSGSGVNVSGMNATSQIDTRGLQSGSYPVSANLSDGSKSGVATCSAKFNVRQPSPPEISCSSDPGRVTTGGTATIRSRASSPDNRPLRYSFSATAGKISGTDATTTLNAGERPGSVTVTCTVSDDRNPSLSASAMTSVIVVAPPPPEIPAEVVELETKLALHSIYFKTARPTEKNPGGGVVESQEAVLSSLAIGFNRYLTFKPDAHLILGGHADSRGTPEYNKVLTERRVDRTKSYLVEHGVPAGSIDVRSYGKEDELSRDQVKEQIARNPDLSENDRQKMLNNLTVIVLANNRRVDVTLSTTGQQSTRRYPFNAKDALGLISTEGVAKEPGATRRSRKR